MRVTDRILWRDFTPNVSRRCCSALQAALRRGCLHRSNYRLALQVCGRPGSVMLENPSLHSLYYHEGEGVAETSLFMLRSVESWRISASASRFNPGSLGFRLNPFKRSFKVIKSCGVTVIGPVKRCPDQQENAPPPPARQGKTSLSSRDNLVRDG